MCKGESQDVKAVKELGAGETFSKFVFFSLMCQTHALMVHRLKKHRGILAKGVFIRDTL